MRLLSRHNGELRLTEYTLQHAPPYAVLSHRWFDDEDEITYRDIREGHGRSKAGYQKLEFCEERALKDGISHFWIDTCCIDKSSSTELTEAINSMFRWYHNSAKCYVFMSDITIENYNSKEEYPQTVWEPAFRKSSWFTRGWTLQELIAPPKVEFFTFEGHRLGDKISLESLLHTITGVPVQALQGSPLGEFSVEERLSWAANRQTKREEDMAYSLFGIFDICLPTLYGEGQERAMRRLKKEIADVEMQKARTLPSHSLVLHKAVKEGNLRLLKEHLRPGSLADVHDLDEHDRTALHYAKTAHVVELLVNAGALVNEEDIDGHTPLHKAVIERRLEVIKKLLSKNAWPTNTDKAGKTPVDYSQHFPAATWLLEHGARRDGLFHMAWLGDIEGVAFFLSQGSDVDKRNPHGETALTEASRHGDTEVVKLLLQAGADLELKTTNGGWTALLLAVSNNRADTVRTLISAGAKLQATDDRNHDALTEAVYQGHWDVARMLIEHGAQVNTADHRGNTPLHCSGHRGNPEFTQFLIDKGARVDAQNVFGGTALLETIEHHPGEAINHARILLNNGANPTIANHNGYTPLSNAAMYGNPEVLELLLSVVEQASAPTNPHFPGAFSWTPLAEACFHAHEECVHLLLDAGVDLELKTADEWLTPLHQAVRTDESSPEIVKLLLKHGSLIEAKDKKGFTPLALAVMHSTPEVVKALLNGGADTKPRFYAGDRPENGYGFLHLAIQDDRTEVAKVLVDAGVDLEAQTAERKYTALMMAAKLHHWDLVSMLIEKGANVNTCDAERTTPLMEAARDGQLWIVRVLVEHNADLRARDSLGRTAWVWAKHEGHGSDFGDFLEDKTKGL